MSDGSSAHLSRSSLNSNNLSVGYVMAISFSFLLLLLLSLLFLSFYLCRRSTINYPATSTTHPPHSNVLVLSRIIFVAEEDSGDASVTTGLDASVVSSYPKFRFSSSKNANGGNALCPICLCDYRDGEMLRLLPHCRHSYHLTCVDSWLRLNAACPVCRAPPLPTPISTPLSEIAPLSHFSAERMRRT